MPIPKQHAHLILRVTSPGLVERTIFAVKQKRMKSQRNLLKWGLCLSLRSSINDVTHFLTPISPASSSRFTVLRVTTYILSQNPWSGDDVICGWVLFVIRVQNDLEKTHYIFFSESRDFWPRISCCLYENAEDWKCWAFQERKYLLIQNKTIWRLLPFSFYFYRILSYSTFLCIFSAINR